MTELTGQQWIVENRGGAGGNVGMDALAKSDPDSYSLGLGGIAAHAIVPTLYAKLPFNAHSDFTFASRWQTPANTLAYGDSEEARLAPIIRASGARVD
jgi:tripartite-type tricarboxylate transporter receptor subunit TctC